MEILSVIIVSSLVGVISFLVADRFIHARRMMELHENAEELLEQFNEKVIYSKIEVEGDMIMMYNNETGEFLAQGKNWAELNQRLKERYPDKWFHLDQGIIDRIKSFDKESA